MKLNVLADVELSNLVSNTQSESLSGVERQRGHGEERNSHIKCPLHIPRTEYEPQRLAISLDFTHFHYSSTCARSSLHHHVATVALIKRRRAKECRGRAYLRCDFSNFSMGPSERSALADPLHGRFCVFYRCSISPQSCSADDQSLAMNRLRGEHWSLGRCRNRRPSIGLSSRSIIMAVEARFIYAKGVIE